MSKSLTQKVSALGTLVAVAALVLSPAVVSAAEDDAGTEVSATVSEVISITTSGTVSFTLAPTGGGVVSSSSDTVTVSTNNSSGYTLTLENADATSNLVSGSDTFTAHTGTQAAPSTLANGTWGYAVQNVGGFGAGARSAESNNSSSTSTWAGVPVLNSPNVIKTTGDNATSDVTTVWYAAKADTSQPTGTYTDNVTYTATTN